MSLETDDSPGALPKLDRRLRPTAGVARLIGEALLDLLLLPWRLLLVALFARRRRRETAELIGAKSHASQDPHPAR